jgi:tRNA G18 (ribose-2'-O)-methylase SpoU
VYRIVRDLDDPDLAPFRHLRDRELRHSLEAAAGVFVVEGVLAIRRALTSRYPVRRVLVTAARAETLAADLDGHDVTVLVAEPSLLAATAGFDLHRGAVAVADRLPEPDLAEVLRSAHLAVVLEGVNDHENLGAIGRCAAALGADALLLDPTCADPFYRRSVRVSVGELLHLPIVRLRRWPEDLTRMSDAGFEVVALTPDPTAEDIDALGSPRPTRRALLFGAEGPGLSAGALSAADRHVRIPLARGVDSLNVSHAAAVALHVLRRLA